MATTKEKVIDFKPKAPTSEVITIKSEWSSIIKLFYSSNWYKLKSSILPAPTNSFKYLSGISNMYTV